jgi:hypothetical protein
MLRRPLTFFKDEDSRQMVCDIFETSLKDVAAWVEDAAPQTERGERLAGEACRVDIDSRHRIHCTIEHIVEPHIWSMHIQTMRFCTVAGIARKC